MDRSRSRALLAAATAVAATLAGVVTVRRARRQTAPELFGDGPAEDRRRRHGRPEDRGRADAFGLDLERLKGTGEFEPVVQYLTYIQEKRGEASHLLFVRYDDLDAMASIDGEPTPSFLERLEQLGVVVSTN